jgi:hypothetical protein
MIMIISDRKYKDALLNEINKTASYLLMSTYGKGTLRNKELADLFGFRETPEKIVLFLLCKSENVDSFFEFLNENCNFKNKNTGVGFSIPLEA